MAGSTAGADLGATLALTRAERLACLEQKANSVHELAKRFEQGLFFDEGNGQNDSPQMQGKQLLSKLIEHSKELRGRVVGRNADDCDEITEGLGLLIMQWDARESQIERAMTEATKAVWEFRQLASSLESSDAKEAEEEQQSRRNEQRVKDLEKRLAAMTASTEKLKEQLRDSEQKNAEMTLASIQDKSEADTSGAAEAKALELASELAREKERTQELEAKMEIMAMKYEELWRDTTAESAASRKAASQAKPQSSGLKPGEYQILGRPMLGGTLRVADENGDPPAGALQWSRAYSDGTSRPIAGACRTQYSPDPMDVGCMLGCTIGKGEHRISALTKAPVVLAPGLTEQVHSSIHACMATFHIVIVQLNGEVQSRNKSMYHLRITGTGVEILSSSGKSKFKAEYSQSMQVCGARGGGDAASHGVYLCLQPNLALMLACENSTERNVCIMLIRQFALKQRIILGGPKDNA